MAHVRTVRGDIPPSELGITYLHEHLIGRPLAAGSNPDFNMDSEDAAIEELHHFCAAGGKALVEMTTRDYSRNLSALRRISETSGVHIIAVTGFIKAEYCDAFVEGRSVTELADEMIRDVMEGVDGIRCGVLKVGSSKDKITPTEEKVFRAAAHAHRETGAPISTHTEAGTMALEQVELLRSEGVEPERILIGHMDRKLDWDYHLAVAQTGVTLGYDQFSKEKYYPDSLRVEYVTRMVKAGFAGQLALSGDLARRSYWTSYSGGPGLTFLLWRILPWLREAGVTQDEIDLMLLHTPRRLLQFEV